MPPFRLATWNVNGVRARWDDLNRWVAAVQPDVFCLQELKATPHQIPEPLTGLPAYHNHWHGGPGGYSGVSLHIRRSGSDAPRFFVPDFDVEHRIIAAELGSPAVVIASIYVHNGQKALEPKLEFLDNLRRWTASLHAEGKRLILAGDLNVTLTDRDLHPKHHKRGGVGQSKRERAFLQAVLGTGLTDSLRRFEPEADDLFTWFPPWREEKQKNRGWRIDYVLVSSPLAETMSSYEIQKDSGTSDHVPYVVNFSGIQ